MAQKKKIIFFITTSTYVVIEWLLARTTVALSHAHHVCRKARSHNNPLDIYCHNYPFFCIWPIHDNNEKWWYCLCLSLFFLVNILYKKNFKKKRDKVQMNFIRFSKNYRRAASTYVVMLLVFVFFICLTVECIPIKN